MPDEKADPGRQPDREGMWLLACFRAVFVICQDRWQHPGWGGFRDDV
jgi:hypothetical protein